MDFKNIPLLKILSKQERDIFFAHSQLKDFQVGDFIFKQNEKRDRFFILTSGLVELQKNVGKQQQTIHIFSAGDFLAEAALTDPDGYHNLTAVVTKETRVLILTAKNFKKFEQKNCQTALKIAKYIENILIERLYHADNKLTTLYLTGQLVGSSEDIIKTAEGILGLIFEVIKANRGCLGLINFDGRLKIIASHGMNRQKDLKGVIVDYKKNDLLKKIIDDQQIVIINQSHVNNSTTMFGPFKSMIGVPLVVANKTKATIILFDKMGDHFNLNNQVLLEAVASQLAASLVLKESVWQQKAEQELKRVYY